MDIKSDGTPSKLKDWPEGKISRNVNKNLKTCVKKFFKK